MLRDVALVRAGCAGTALGSKDHKWLVHNLQHAFRSKDDQRLVAPTFWHTVGRLTTP